MVTPTPTPSPTPTQIATTTTLWPVPVVWLHGIAYLGTLKATVTPTAATGTIQFKRNGTVFDTQHVTNGTATDGIVLNVALLDSANYTAVYTPDNPAHGPSTSNTVRLPKAAVHPIPSGE